jgi:hypothetical protein
LKCSGARGSPAAETSELGDDTVKGKAPEIPLPDMSKLSLDEITLLGRPGYGSAGEEVHLWANYFNIEGLEDLVLYEHSVSIDRDPRRLRRSLFSELLRSRELSGKTVATDYRGRLICTEQLPEQLPEQGLRIRGYGFAIEFKRSFNFRDVLADLRSAVPRYALKPETPPFKL